MRCPRDVTYLTSTVEANVSVQLGSATLSCAATPPTSTLSAAYAAGCPAPFASLADQLDMDRLAASILRWQLDAATGWFRVASSHNGLVAWRTDDNAGYARTRFGTGCAHSLASPNGDSHWNTCQRWTPARGPPSHFWPRVHCPCPVTRAARDCFRTCGRTPGECRPGGPGRRGDQWRKPFSVVPGTCPGQFPPVGDCRSH